MQAKDIPLKTILQLIYDHDKKRTKLFAYEVLIGQGIPEKVVYAKYDNIDSKGYVNCGVSLRTGWLTQKGIDRLKELGGDT